ncbi:MAG: FAD-dependent pyridine nucleotide-disulfide oxidoreductase [Myxococcales bacterium]|nr:FAD-dependent pyridine nucleotide-disulfide oxidoreductase [Myxococcales bacterium]
MVVTARRRVSFLTAFLALILIAITVGLAYRGWGFYQLSVEDRVEHPDFRELRPSGLFGNGYGWVAAMLIILNLSYLIRRRFGGSRHGSMRVWLDLHVFTGLVAASLVSFHSAFQLRTPVATLSTASLGVVVLTGLIGRFLYALAPANGRERMKAALDEIERELPGQRVALAEAIAARPGPTLAANASLLRSLWAIPAWRRAGRGRREVLEMLLPKRSAMSKSLRRTTSELFVAAAVDARASGVSALLRSWRGLHRFFALLMLAAVLLHAGVAWHYGYRWIFT